MDYTFRNIEETDYYEVCKLPQTEEELFFMFPKADYPLTNEQLSENLKTRSCPTVILDKGVIIGFANFYNMKENESCWIGNLIVHPSYRRKGMGKLLVRTMEKKAREAYNVKEIKTACFIDNVPALKLYHRMGYVPFGMEERFNKHGSSHLLINMKNERRNNIQI